MSNDSKDILARIDSDKERYLTELKELLRIPSISTDPEYSDKVLEAASWLVARLTDAGLTTEKIDTAGYPLVYAEWTKAEGKPTVLIYGHYDVQPVDPVDLWRHPPFEPTVEDGQLVCRGATDDKGQSFAHVAALSAILAERGELPVNVKVILEGEEESGGEAIEAFVRADGGKRLGCDCVLVSDGSMYGPGQPSLLYGLKGLAYMELKVTGPNRDLHSGSFGGAVTNPANALCHIIDRLRDSESGKILIDGFYDDVVPLADWERQAFAKLPFDQNAYNDDLGVKEEFGEEGYSTLERVWARPTCDVNGIFGGYEGKGAKTVLPAWAGAKVSMRLVPNQDPEKIAALFKAYVKKVTPPGVTVDVQLIHVAEPVVVDATGPYADAALAAMEDIWGKEAVRVREGGSIPIVSTFATALKAPVLLVGFGLPDDRLHSPNEKIDLENFYNGIRTSARLLDRFAQVR